MLSFLPVSLPSLGRHSLSAFIHLFIKDLQGKLPEMHYSKGQVACGYPLHLHLEAGCPSLLEAGVFLLLPILCMFQLGLSHPTLVAYRPSIIQMG